MPRKSMGPDFMRDLTQEFMSGNTSDVTDVITFIEAPWGLNFPLYPSQKFALKAFYGIPLDDQHKTIEVPTITNDKILYRFSEVEFLQWLYDEGRCNTNDLSGKKFTEMVLVFGRRAGKSELASCISCYELYKLVKRGSPSDYYGFPADTQICITNVAPTDDQAGVVFDMVQSKTMHCAYLKQRTVNQTLTYFNLQTDSDREQLSKKKRASLLALAGGCASNSLRGRNNIVIVMDEMAFFIDNNGRFSGSEVYKALKPSTASFRGDGKVICISSPYAKYGAFWDRYNDSFNDPDTTLMFKMYSALVNPSIDSTLLKSERRRDKVGFMCEYGAEFSDSITAWIDDELQFRACINVGQRRPSKGKTGVDYFMGVDLGLKKDGTAISIVHRDDNTKKVIVDWSDVWFSASSDVWDVERSIYTDCVGLKEHEIIPVQEIVMKVKELCRWFPIKAGWFDQYNGYAFLEMLHGIGLKQFHMEQITDKLNNRMYQLVKTLYADQMIEFYDDSVLISELLLLEAERKAKHNVEVRAPNKKGAHDDISDATACAIWEAYNSYKERGENIVNGVRAGSVMPIVSMNMFRQAKAKRHGATMTRVPQIVGKRTRFR